MTENELIALRLSRQHISSPADHITVVRDLLGLQSQFLTQSLHSLSIRSNDGNITDGIVRNWTIRGTVHIFARDDLPLFIGCRGNYRSLGFEG